MWKWIIGAGLVVVLGLAATCYTGYRKLTGSGDSVTITIHANPDHVFATLVNADSMLAWLPAGAEITSTGKGAFRAGDTLRMTSPVSRGSERKQTQVFVIRDVRPSTRLVVDAIQFNPSGTPRVVYTRSDSLVANGDSTKIFTSFVAGDPLGAPAASPSAGGTQGAILGVAGKMMVGAARVMREVQMKQVKTHIEQP